MGIKRLNHGLDITFDTKRRLGDDARFSAFLLLSILRFCSVRTFLHVAVESRRTCAHQTGREAQNPMGFNHTRYPTHHRHPLTFLLAN
jgi:hypothetical protein